MRRQASVTEKKAGSGSGCCCRTMLTLCVSSVTDQIMRETNPNPTSGCGYKLTSQTVLGRARRWGRIRMRHTRAAGSSQRVPPSINIFPASDNTEKQLKLEEISISSQSKMELCHMEAQGSLCCSFAPLMFFSCVIGTWLPQEHSRLGFCLGGEKWQAGVWWGFGFFFPPLLSVAPKSFGGAGR